MAQLPSNLLKDWVLSLSAIPEAAGGVYIAQPLGSLPDWERLERGAQVFAFREGGKFSYSTFLPNDYPVEVNGTWELEPDSGHMEIELWDIGDAYIGLATHLVCAEREQSASLRFTLKILTLDDEMLEFEILEELIEDNDHVPTDVG